MCSIVWCFKTNQSLAAAGEGGYWEYTSVDDCFAFTSFDVLIILFLLSPKECISIYSGVKWCNRSHQTEQGGVGRHFPPCFLPYDLHLSFVSVF